MIADLTPTERALEAALKVDGRTDEAEVKEYLSEIVYAVLDAVGYDALKERCEAAERNLQSACKFNDLVIELHERACNERNAMQVECDRLRERVRQLDHARDRLNRAWKRLDRAIEPERQCICSDGSDVMPPDRVPVCAYHGGQTWWIVAEARAARAALDFNPELDRKE